MFKTFFNIAILRSYTSFYKTLADGYIQKLLQLFRSVVSVWNYFQMLHIIIDTEKIIFGIYYNIISTYLSMDKSFSNE